MPTAKVNRVGARRLVGTDSNGHRIVIVGQEIPFAAAVGAKARIETGFEILGEAL